MPLTLLIESELDERSATAAAERAERVYAEASQNISRSMSSQIAGGARESGQAVERMADSARASYQKVLKAQDELAKQERELRKMREEGARGVEVQAELVRRARRQERDAIREAAGAMEEYDQATQRAGESGERAGSTISRGFRSGMASLRTGLNESVAEFTSQFGAMGVAASSAFARISTGGAVAALGVAGVGLAAVAVGQQLYQLGAQWDQVGDSIAMRTGKFGPELQGITDSVRRVASDTAAPIEVIGDIGGQVAQSMKLAGPELDDMTQRLTILQEAGNPVGVRDLAKSYNLFGIEAKDQINTLDRLFNVSQQTGIPMQELVTTLNQAGRATKEFGLDASQTAGLLATMEGAGVNGDSATKALTIALKNFSKEGKDAGPALAETVDRIQALADAGRDSDAAMLAASTFGGKSYLDMLNAIKDHRLTSAELSAPFEDAGKSIKDAADNTEDLAEQWQKFKNNLQSGPIADSAAGVFDAFNTVVGRQLETLQRYNDKFAELFGFSNNKMLGGGGSFGGSNLIGGGVGVPGLAGGRAGIGGSDLSTVAPGTPFWGYPDKDSKTGGSSSAQVPYGPGYGRAPRPGESTAMYQADQNVLEAQHKRATAEAVLAQVMSDSTHTTNDEIKAQNDLAQAKKGEIDANMRLHDTSVKAAESLNKAAGQMSEFGATIDADFGASKGLPGILENIVKFVGNLALAGPMAQMNAISAANPNQGSGLMGMLASTGAFGPQYTPQALAAAGNRGGGYGPSATPGGLPSRDQVDAIAASFGLTRTSGDRNEPGSYHNIPGAAGDYSNGSGNTAQELAFAQYMANNFGPYIKELIYSDPQFSQLIGDGKNVTGTGYYSAGTLSEHRNHVHIAGMGQGGGGGPVPVSVTNGPEMLSGFNWDAVAAKESSGNWSNADTGHNGHFGGLQFSPSTWNAFGGQEFAPMPHLATPEQQKIVADRTAFYGYNGTKPQGLGAWEVITNGSTAPDGITVNSRPPGAGGWGGGGSPVAGSPGQGFPLPWNLGVGPGGTPAPLAPGGWLGSGGAGAAPGVGSAVGQDPFGVAPTTGPGGGGIGITPGGSIDTAIGIAAAGANLIAPGAGAAAQAGIKLASRAIQYGGQVAGIAADGLLQTFLPAGSQKAGSGWLQRGVGALASVKPALPNLAGGKGSPNAQNGQAAGQGQQPGQQPPGGNTYNTTVNSSASTITGAAKDAEFHFSAQNSGPGP